LIVRNTKLIVTNFTNETSAIPPSQLKSIYGTGVRAEIAIAQKSYFV
ncbi:unnamed protein product, partial [marine sediment metagenome]